MRKSFIQTARAALVLSAWGCQTEPAIERVVVDDGSGAAVVSTTTIPSAEIRTDFPPGIPRFKDVPPAAVAGAPKALPPPADDGFVENRGQAGYVDYLSRQIGVDLRAMGELLRRPDVRRAMQQNHDAHEEDEKAIVETRPTQAKAGLPSVDYVPKADVNCPGRPAFAPECDRLASLGVMNSKNERVPVVTRWNKRAFPIQVGLHESFDEKFRPILAFVVRQFNAFMRPLGLAAPALALLPGTFAQASGDRERHLFYFSDYDPVSQKARRADHRGYAITYTSAFLTGEIADADIHVAYGKLTELADVLGSVEAPAGAREQFVRLAIYVYAAHELGHLLGMDHNFQKQGHDSFIDYYSIPELPLAATRFFDSRAGTSYDFLTLRYLYDDAFTDIAVLPFRVVRARPEDDEAVDG